MSHPLEEEMVMHNEQVSRCTSCLSIRPSMTVSVLYGTSGKVVSRPDEGGNFSKDSIREV